MLRSSPSHLAQTSFSSFLYHPTFRLLGGLFCPPCSSLMPPRHLKLRKYVFAWLVDLCHVFFLLHGPGPVWICRHKHIQQCADCGVVPGVFHVRSACWTSVWVWSLGGSRLCGLLVLISEPLF